MKENKEKLYICRCEEVTKEEIEAAIAEGALTLSGIKKRTHAGMGLCQGRTCRRLITDMLKTKKDPADILPPTVRVPVRVVKIDEIVKGEEA
ncbi:MAG: (2Fe-2S)-binding protein [Clostridia bacterium]|jgi:NAD(P)H-nitrite reductase large subunit|nr:(2Fe-2S)-binding protein [Clostridia bacterium]